MVAVLNAARNSCTLQRYLKLLESLMDTHMGVGMVGMDTGWIYCTRQ